MQSYVLAAAQVGAHNEKRVSYGHSMIVSPWGEVIAQLGGEWKGPEIVTAEIDLEMVKKIRRDAFAEKNVSSSMCATSGKSYINDL